MPWSTVIAPTRTSARGPTNAAAAASAIESAPPEQATRTSAPAGRSASEARTAARTSSPAADVWLIRGPRDIPFIPRDATAAACGSRFGQRHRRRVHPAHPRRRVTDLGQGGQVRRLGPYAVESVHAHPVDHTRDKAGTIAVLAHLGIHPEDPARHPVEPTAAGSPLLELRADLPHRRDPLGAYAIHHAAVVSLQQRPDPGQLI